MLALGRAVVGAREEGQQGKHGLVRGAAASDLEQALVAQEPVQPPAEPCAREQPQASFGP